MRTRRFNAIRRADEVFEPIDAALRPLGFTRTENVYHRHSDHDVFPGVEAVTFGFAYGFRTCWMHTTVKIPALIELLAEVRPFAYDKTLAWRVPDHASHVACMLRLSEMAGTADEPLPEGLHWRDDGRLQRSRRVPAAVLGNTLAALARRFALPALRERLTLRRLAAAADAPGYGQSGIAGAWPLAARLALGDLEGAAQAFRAHPYALGSDRMRFMTAKAWLQGCGLALDDVAWNAAAAEAADPWEARAWLTGELVK